MAMSRRNIETNTTTNQELEDVGNGTAIHVINVLISMGLMLLFALYRGQNSKFSIFCLTFCQLGLIFDNVINALGKHIGEGTNLRNLSKGRFLFHVAGIPLLAVPITEVASEAGIFTERASTLIVTSVTSWAIFDFCNWLFYDIRKLKLVDLRGSMVHDAGYLAGTLAYTSEKIVEMVLPCILLVLYELTIGCAVLYFCDETTTKIGIIMVLSAILTGLSCTVPGRPDIQLYGENLHGGMIWIALMRLI